MLIYSIILLLISAAVSNKRDNSILFSRITILALINTIIILAINFNINYINKGIIIYGGLFIIKNYIIAMILFTLILSIFIIGITSFFSRFDIENKLYVNITTAIYRSLNRMSYEYRIIEYPLIILFCITGAIFLMCSYDLVSVFLAIELQSYGLYLLCSIYRNSESSINAGLTYFLLGGLSSCIILLGISLLYINTGNTNLENIYMMYNISNAYTYDVLFINNNYNYYDLYTHGYIQLPLSIMSIGFLFKIGSAPFHFWSPDVYDAIPTNVTVFVAIIAKISILILLFELSFIDSGLKTFSWLNNIILSSFLSLLIGSILGLIQYRIKRLYAYSTISHIGFILLALAVNSWESSKAFIFYIIQYSLSNLNAFIILIYIGYNLYFYIINSNIIGIKKDNFSPIQLISQLKGYYYVNPFVAISLCLTLFSFVGIPPLIGFFGKQLVLIAALDKGYIFITLVAILTSVISAVYYLVIVKIIFFDKSIYKNLSYNNIKVTRYLSFSISILTSFILLFMFYDYELMDMISILMLT